MRAAVLTEYERPLEIQDVDEPSAGPDGVVVETEACGVCRSDWHAWTGDWDWVGSKPPRGQILGHEPAGRVVEVGGDVQRVSVGDRVAVPFTLGDGTCEYCRRGMSNVCANLRPLGFAPQVPGAFAERFAVPDADVNAVILPEDLDPVDMAALGCRFTTAFHALAHRADVSGGDWVVVHGCGGVGLSAVHIADALGARVIAVDLDQDALARATDLGAAETIDAGSVDRVGSEVKRRTDGGADVAVDALGIAETCRNAVRSLGRTGTHVQIGLTTSEEQGEVSLPVDAMTMQEIDFLGSFGMPAVRYDEILSMIAAGRLDPGRVVSDRIALDDVSATLERMGDYETHGIPVVTSFS